MKTFARKIDDQLLEWKEMSEGRYALLLEGARGVGKTTAALRFARRAYASYILIDFSCAPREVMDCFSDIGDLDRFFLRLQAVTGITLIRRQSLVIFDEVQDFPRARQAIRYLVADGRYDYLETGSLVHACANVRDILIPSEEDQMVLHPMDWEEFMEACGNGTYHVLRELYQSGQPLGPVRSTLMKNFLLYMAIGGMPQAVQAYLEGKNCAQIDEVKREILARQEEDLERLDPSGRTLRIWRSVPAQLAAGHRSFGLRSALGRKTPKDGGRLWDLQSSGMALVCRQVREPQGSIRMATEEVTRHCRLYPADTGLLVTALGRDHPAEENALYAQLLSGQLPAELGFLYEAAVAQVITASGRELYYHTWERKGSTHYYEVSFLLRDRGKVTPLEVSASGRGRHASLRAFSERYAREAAEGVVLSPVEVSRREGITFLPICLAPFLAERAVSGGNGVY